MCESKQDVIEAVIKKLQKGNQDFVETEQNNGDISQLVRTRNVEEGQKPVAVVVTCSDSRVPP